jgi:hypothetical protein
MIDLGYWRVTPDEEIPVALDDDAHLFFPDYDMDVDIAAEALGIGESRPIKMLKLFKFRPPTRCSASFPSNQRFFAGSP